MWGMPAHCALIESAGCLPVQQMTWLLSPDTNCNKKEGRKGLDKKKILESAIKVSSQLPFFFLR